MQQYTQLIRRMERDARISPYAFRIRVMLVSFSTYVAIFGALLVAVALIWHAIRLALAAQLGAFTLKLAVLALAPLAIIGLALRALSARIPPPRGRPVGREEAPALFQALDRMQAKLSGPTIHHVLIDSRYNAAIAQLPRFPLCDLLGGHTNYLMVGLPYLLGVPTTEMLATVAHEYGHLCGHHGRMGAWVYRQRRVFGTLYERVHDKAEESFLHHMVGVLLDRLMPYYNAYTFVLSRQNEYDADRIASRLAGTKANAACLVRDALQMRWMHDAFWPTLLAHSHELQEPPFMPYASMRTAFKAGYATWATPENLEAALAERSGLRDTHPCLRERLDAIGEEAVLPAPTGRVAADVLLGATTTRRLIEEFDAHWWKREAGNWQQRYRHGMRARQRMAELAARPQLATAVEELQELGLLKAEYEEPAQAKPALERLLAQPGRQSPQAMFHYGRLLLDDGNADGLRHLQVAAGADPALTHAAAMLGHQFLLRTQDELAAEEWLELLRPWRNAPVSSRLTAT